MRSGKPDRTPSQVYDSALLMRKQNGEAIDSPVRQRAMAYGVVVAVSVVPGKQGVVVSVIAVVVSVAVSVALRSVAVVAVAVSATAVPYSSSSVAVASTVAQGDAVLISPPVAFVVAVSVVVRPVVAVSVVIVVALASTEAAPLALSLPAAPVDAALLAVVPPVEAAPLAPVPGALVPPHAVNKLNPNTTIKPNPKNLRCMICSFPPFLRCRLLQTIRAGALEQEAYQRIRYACRDLGSLQTVGTQLATASAPNCATA